MHIALGYRYSGCGGGPAAGWVGSMGSMMSGRFAGAVVALARQPRGGAAP